MSGGGSSQPTQQSTTKVEMSPEQRELYQLAMPGVREFAAKVPERYPGTQIAGFDPSQVAGQEMALAAAPLQGNLAATGAQANTNLLQNIWDPNFNPGLKGAVDAAVRPVTEQYQQQTLPGLRDEFQGAGQQFGGSRRGVADVNAMSKYLQNVGDVSSKVVGNAYDTNMRTYLQALGLVPQTSASLLSPATTTSGVGDIRQNMAQALLGEQVAGFNYEQLAPFLQSQDIISLISGIPGGTSQTLSTGNTPQKNQMMSALGGAAAGASLGTAIMPGVGTAAGAGLGALLSFL
jgi:hypothetical protein